MEGQRNSTLYRVAAAYRKHFGLAGDDLIEKLSDFNQQKCTPPLDDEEVIQIAQSVDRSDIPIGDPSATSIGRQVKKSSVPKHRIVYAVIAATVAVLVADLLTKMVSIYKTCKSNIPFKTTTIGKVLAMFRVGGTWVYRIAEIRNEPDKEVRKALKERLPAIVFGSEPQTKRRNSACKANGVICLDFDGIEESEIEEAKKAIAAVPYVFAVGRSASGKGLFALAAYVGTPKLKTVLAAMQGDFEYKLDPSRSDLAGLRIATHDPDMIIKDEVFPAVLTEQTETETVSDDGADFDPTKYIPFPIECLPSVIRNFIKAVQQTIGLKDCGAPAIVCLAVIAAAIGASCKIRIKRGYEQPAHVFVAIVRRSGQAKSTSIEYPLEVFYEIQNQWMDEYANAKARYELELARWNAIPKKDRPVPPTAPVPKRLIITDATFEAVGQLLTENLLGLLEYCDELEGFFGNMGRYSGGKDLPYFLVIHNGKPLSIDRKGAGLLYIPSPSLVICGGIQTAVLKQRLEDNPEFFHSGFMARFLIAMPPVEALKLNAYEIPEEERSGYERFVADIFSARENTLIGNKVFPNVFPLSTAAWDTLVEYQHRHADLAVYEQDGNAAVEGKFATNTARIALILHVAGLVESRTPLSDLTPVSGETMHNACIVTEWFTEEAKRIYNIFSGELVDSGLTAEQRKVISILRKYDVPMTNNEIRNRTNPRNRISSEQVDAALQRLKLLGQVGERERQHKGGKGRPTMEWFVIKNP